MDPSLPTVCAELFHIAAGTAFAGPSNRRSLRDLADPQPTFSGFPRQSYFSYQSVNSAEFKPAIGLLKICPKCVETDKNPAILALRAFTRP
jgi:hypothetical protein